MSVIKEVLEPRGIEDEIVKLETEPRVLVPDGGEIQIPTPREVRDVLSKRGSDFTLSLSSEDEALRKYFSTLPGNVPEVYKELERGVLNFIEGGRRDYPKGIPFGEVINFKESLHAGPLATFLENRMNFDGVDQFLLDVGSTKDPENPYGRHVVVKSIVDVEMGGETFEWVMEVVILVFSNSIGHTDGEQSPATTPPHTHTFAVGYTGAALGSKDKDPFLLEQGYYFVDSRGVRFPEDERGGPILPADQNLIYLVPDGESEQRPLNVGTVRSSFIEIGKLSNGGATHPHQVTGSVDSVVLGTFWGPVDGVNYEDKVL